MAKVGCLALCASVIQHAASNKMDSSGVKVLEDDTNPLISAAFFGAAVDQWGHSFKLRTHGAVHTCITPTSAGQVILSDCDKTDHAQCFKYKRHTKMLKAFGAGSSSDTAASRDCLHTEEKGTTPTLDMRSCDSCGAEDCKFVPSMPDKLGYFSLSALGGKLEAGTGYLSFVDNKATGTAVRFYSDYEEDCKEFDSSKVPGSSGEVNLADTPIAVGKHAHTQAERMMKAADAAAAELSAASPTTEKIAEAHSKHESMMAEADAAAVEVSSVSAKTEEKKTQPMLGESSDDMVTAAEDAAQEVIGKMADHHARGHAEAAAREVMGKGSDHHARGLADAAAEEVMRKMHSDDSLAKGLNEKDDALAQGLNEKADDAPAQGSKSEIEGLANLALARQHKKA